jgi:outer membrane protein assembly factor BamE (lipoprotein component of BamABCDE complex)
MERTPTSAANRNRSLNQPAATMKSYSKFWRLFSVLVAAIFALSACNGKRLTKANVDQVNEGMTKKQVESVLGPPTSIDSKDYVLFKKTTYHYQQENDSVTIVFKEDKVESKESTLHD